MDTDINTEDNGWTALTMAADKGFTCPPTPF